MWHRLTFSLLLLAAAACKSTSAPSGGSPNTVTIQDFTFAPSTLMVKVSTTVTWTNNGPHAHTTTSDAAGLWDSGTLSPPSGGGGYGGASAGGSFQHTFMMAGTFGYHCTLHPPSSYPGFIGAIVVTP